MADTLSAEDKEFLAQCEEEFKDRYTEKDDDFMKVFNEDPPKPPVVDSWWVPQNSGRRNDRRYNRRNQQYERPGRDRDQQHRGYSDQRQFNDNRGYNDYNRGYDDRGGNRQRHRYNY